MKYKIHGGQVVDAKAFYKPDHIGGVWKSQELGLLLGNLTHTYARDRNGWPNVFKVQAQIESAEIITEDNKVNFLGAAGWGGSRWNSDRRRGSPSWRSPGWPWQGDLLRFEVQRRNSIHNFWKAKACNHFDGAKSWEPVS